MDVEHKIVSLPVDDNLQGEVQRLEADGWQIPAGVPPVMVYHLIRMKKPLEAEVRNDVPDTFPFKLTIDDALISVLGPDGKPKQ